METFLETLKLRLQDAQKRLQTAQQSLQKAQNEFNVAAQEANSWNIAVAAETRKVNLANTVLVTSSPNDGAPAQIANQPAAPPPPTVKPETNKTELVRVCLQQHPNGVTPGDLWEQLKSQLGQRAYLYSVLKRLKDKDEIQERRGKYSFKHRPQPEEGRNPNAVMQ